MRTHYRSYMDKNLFHSTAGVTPTSILLATMLLGGCSMTQSASKIPMANTLISTPTDLTNARIFDCAELAIVELSKTSSSWPKASLRDEENGVLESGEYPADDKTGFRMRLERVNAGAGLQIHLKGAGAYYVDLGVQKAMTELTSKVESCINVRES